MANLENPSNAGETSVPGQFSMSNFFNECYDKGIVSAVSDHPKEATATAVGAAAAAYGLIKAAPIAAVGRILGGSAAEGEGLNFAANTLGTAEDGSLRALAGENPTNQAGKNADPFKLFSSENYRWVPPRTLATTIRTGEGTSITQVDGPSKILFNSDNSIGHVLLNKAASPTEKADLLMQASYAGMIRTDLEAAKAAALAKTGPMSYLSSVFGRPATNEQLQRAAIDGAGAYVRMDTAAANPFTNYLKNLYGPMTEESQAWGRHILTDTSSPSSAWNSTIGAMDIMP